MTMTEFLFDDDYPVRSFMVNGDPWFVLVDVCRALDIANSRDAAARLDEDEKGVGISDTLGGPQEMTIISESGLHTIILRSNDATTPGTTAHRFRRWVTHEVLPSIRRTGGYQLAGLVLTPDDHLTNDGAGKFPGHRFREERERLGFATARDLTDALGFAKSKAYQFEELGTITQRLNEMQALEAVGFDTLYWRTGFRTLTRAERKILDALRSPAAAGVAAMKLSIPAPRVEPANPPKKITGGRS